jgi:selenide,water dikinase
MKFGLSVTGFVHPDHVWSNAGAQSGDVLILTKALGTGTLTAALKRGEVTEHEIQDGLDSMCLLNNVSENLSAHLLSSIHAATDITGFGLAGHALNLARASSVGLTIEAQRLPKFSRAMELIDKGFLTKAHRTNSDYVKEQTRFSFDNTCLQQLVFDPQTSGGLLLAVDASAADQVLAQIVRRFPMAQKIGVVRAAGDAMLQFS